VTKRLTIVRHGAAAPAAGPGETIISTEELKEWIRSGALLTRIGSFGEVRLRTDRVDALGRPLPAAVAARMLSRGPCYAEDAGGRRRPLDAATLARWTISAAFEPLQRRSFVASIERQVAGLEAESATGPQHTGELDLRASPLYLRADLSFGVKAGGSVGHTAGVINHLGDFGAAPIAVTSDPVPTVSPAIESHAIAPDEAFWQYRELPSMVMNDTVIRAVESAVGDRIPSFIYQRYTVNGFAAVQLARRWGVRLITEYNGSEVWVARHWGRPLEHDTLSRRIERLNLRAAHLVSVVSAPLAEEVRAAGVEARRILINPNGVEPDIYRPDIDASAIRARLGLDNRIVIGFIGTFGPWHGAEVLARAFAEMLASEPHLRARVRMLWIGDGGALLEVKKILSAGGAQAESVFTGLVPQSEGPSYLAACDIFASPHVPNPDGSPFFGSPTKLFEYMAMGRAIVASALDQISELLEHDRTAVLVAPGDHRALAAALTTLAADPERRQRLGDAARRVAVEHHSWHAHVGRTIAALRAVS
jgi:glycosyltransferase involved in cell wall biosynthesis